MLIDAFPRYRDYSFFVVEDEIVFVDRGHKVVDIVPAGPRTRFSGSSSSTAVAVNLSEPEIREVQQVLVQRGFLHGRVTGVWGPETREALITFQRKEGFSATGSIDTRTVGALGLSGKVKAQEFKLDTGSNSTHDYGTKPERPAHQWTGTSAEQHDRVDRQQNPSDKQSSSGQTNPPSTTGQGTGTAAVSRVVAR